MATCPQCGGFLSSNHRCFGLWRNRVRWGSVAVSGGLIGIGVATLLSPEHPLLLTGIAALLGAVVVSAVWHEIR